jgi:hypothetical protein
MLWAAGHGLARTPQRQRRILAGDPATVAGVIHVDVVILVLSDQALACEENDITPLALASPMATPSTASGSRH